MAKQFFILILLSVLPLSGKTQIAYDFREQFCLQASVPGWSFYNTLEYSQLKRIRELHVRSRTHYNHGLLADGITKVAVYTFDAAGNLTRFARNTTTDSTLFYESKKYKYNLINQLVEETDSGTRAIIYKYHFYYNEKGQRVKQTVTVAGKIQTTVVYLYDKQNRLIEQRSTSGKNVHRYIFRYNDQGLLEQNIHMEDHLQREKMAFTYNGRGWIDTMKIYRSKGMDTLTDYYIYQYDSVGNRLQAEWFDKGGKWYSTNSYEYNESNQLIHQEYRSRMISRVRKFAYDSSGLEIREWNGQNEDLYDLLVYDYKGNADRVVLENVNFETNSSSLLSSSFRELDNLCAYLNANPTMQIEIAGHTDNVGDEEHNQELSEARAKSVAQYLVDKGIDSARIVFRGYGSSKPISPNDTEQGRQQNRRVEFIISGQH